MELKPYQQQVINDLSLFLEYIQETKDIPDSFNDFWKKHPRTPLTPFPEALLSRIKIIFPVYLIFA